MTHTLTREEKISDAFLVLGSQYYVHARYSAQFFYLPVSATLFHHAIEMLLKGYLSKRKSSSKLKNVGHNLINLWEQFKVETQDITLTCFDETIRRLDRVELLRYPDSVVDEGYALHVSLGSPNLPLQFPGTEHLPQYYVNVNDLDDIAITIFQACNVASAPFFISAPPSL